MSATSAFDENDFEFERKFWVREFPRMILAEPSSTLIIQNYLVANDGTVLRVRVAADVEPNELSFHIDGAGYTEQNLLHHFRDRFDFASVGVKGPPAGGTRYEKEMTLDIGEALKLVAAPGHLVAKQRHGMFVEGDGWNIDAFCGANFPLIIAECERSGPVTKLTIPAYCTTEVTDDLRFTNDGLALSPFSNWSDEFFDDYDRRGSYFRQDFD